MREIPDSERDGVQIDAAVGDRVQVFGISFEPAEAARLFEPAFSCAALAFGEHVGVDVADYDFGSAVVVDRCAVFEHAEGDVARSACDVEDRLARFLFLCVFRPGGFDAGVYRSDEVIFP